MAENPIVTLAGKPYSVPPLVPRQQREVIPAIIKFREIFVALAKNDPSKITSDNLTDLYKIVYWGVLWANRTQFKDGKPHFETDLLDANVTFNEITAAIVVVREQTGFFGDATAGEAQAEALTNSTGT